MNDERSTAAAGKEAQPLARYAARIEEILDIAEQIAEEIRADAEREAEAHVTERRRAADQLFADRVRTLAEFEDTFLDHANRARDELARIGAEFDRMIATLHAPEEMPAPGAAQAEGESGPARTRAIGHSDSAERSPGPPRASGGSDRAQASGATDAPTSGLAASANAILRATQLAVAGGDRGEIEAVLRDEFNVADSAAVVDSILAHE